jgi:PAS domain S-box-containing protein
MEAYRRLIETSPDGILIIENDRIAFANPSAAALFGVNGTDELVGRSLVDLFSAEQQQELRDFTTSCQAGQKTSPVDLSLQRADGTTCDVSVAGALLSDEGNRMVQLVVRDIAGRKQTERALRENEERLTLAVAGAQEGVWDWNLETGAVVYSTRWKEMLGYADDEIEPHVDAWEKLLHPDDKEQAKRLNESVMAGADTYQGEFRLLHKDGHYVEVLSRGYPVRTVPGGPVVRIVGTHFDLTERKRAESERARREFLARLVFAQEDERRRIAREMHDQFGEHLTALALRIRLLKDASADRADWRAHVESIEAIAQRLDHDVDQLVWQLRPTALDDLGLRAALANYVQDWSARVGIPARLHSSGLMDERLPADVETALYRIAQEALTNVAKHAGASGVEVILERRADSVVLIVEDDGVGFEPASRETATEGFGLLGMRERASLVGAALEIESSPGNGTAVFVRMTTPVTGKAPQS